MTKIKICGLSRPEDIETVNRLLPDFIGFVFAPSRRNVDVKTASQLRKNLDSRIEAVGVFVNENIGTIKNIYQDNIIDIVQLHGDEDDEYIRQLKEHCNCPVIKAVGIGDMLPTLPAAPDYLLFDTRSEQRGGIGRTFDWNLLNEHKGLSYFLAGGLSLENVADAIHLLDPFCVDVSSGVETGGIKDAKKMEQFIHLVASERTQVIRDDI
jgi:phosphoribosylanthranilate isomerase